MSFTFPQKILFKHCDPAGIVFYPRYFEMINDCVEAFFDQVLGFPFEDIHQENGVPTAEISVQFKAASRHGDHLCLNLTCIRLGRSSLGLETSVMCGDSLRFTATSTLVYVDENGKSAPWPNAVHAKLEQQMKGR